MSLSDYSNTLLKESVLIMNLFRHVNSYLISVYQRYNNPKPCHAVSKGIIFIIIFIFYLPIVNNTDMIQLKQLLANLQIQS